MSDNCPVCGCACKINGIANRPGLKEVNCAICGGWFAVDRFVSQRIELSDRHKVSSFIYETILHHSVNPYVFTERDKIPKDLDNTYCIDEILNRFPKTVQEILDRSLLNFYKMESTPNKVFTIDSYNLIGAPVSTLFAENYSVAYFYLDALKMQKMILFEALNGGVQWQIKLTVQGFNRIYELQAADPSKSKSVFVALDFKHKDAYSEAIKPLLLEMGYDPVCLLDDDPAHDHIDNAIMAGIRKSRFVISDLTYNNNGAYWEAGMAYGKGKVVVLCRQREKDAEGEWKDPAKLVHFDLNHFKILLYEDWDDLKKQLRDRIEADGRIALV